VILVPLAISDQRDFFSFKSLKNSKMDIHKFLTQALHVGHGIKLKCSTSAVPFFQSTTNDFGNTNHAAYFFHWKKEALES
jgi:hypothetical protein